jgi:hypothetical protein
MAKPRPVKFEITVDHRGRAMTKTTFEKPASYYIGWICAGILAVSILAWLVMCL